MHIRLMVSRDSARLRVTVCLTVRWKKGLGNEAGMNRFFHGTVVNRPQVAQVERHRVGCHAPRPEPAFVTLYPAGREVLRRQVLAVEETQQQPV